MQVKALRLLFIHGLVLFMAPDLRAQAPDAVEAPASVVPAAVAEPPADSFPQPAGGAAAVRARAPVPPAASSPAGKVLAAVRNHIRKGGRIVMVLIGLSVLALTFAIERLLNLRAGRVVPGGLGERADALWKERQFDELRNLCRRDRSILADMILTIVDHRDNDIAHIQTFAHDLGSRELRLELRRAYPLAVIATLAPLLGLLGTVVGMIGAFETVAFAGSMGDPSLLADDISKALITTQDGLVVAIPTLALYHYFRSQTNYFSVLLEDQASELISRWFMQKQKA